MDRNSSLYTFLYASGMVILVAALLATAATSLKPAQQKNKETEKRIDILKSVGKSDGADKAPNRHQFVDDAFNKYVAEMFVVNSKGDKIEGVDAFDIDLKAEQAKPVEQRYYPIYKAKLDNQSIKYIIPVRGRGLWGPIWGYIALNDDLSTIFGATFDHKGETPGLGAEINTVEFQQQFTGKSIFDNSNRFVSISVVKGGADKGNPHAVDAISGGTITSVGLETMVRDCLSGYQAFFNKQKNAGNEQ
ncbi:MAG: NADH:ubiquinone reductase (Na(+)-transporting) subunit C [Bacteroidales bacterium]|nr:NADH:ubiquinone reductase (Na(+)-transporting) subunit C [Bacteroidales bacterium]